MSLLSRGVALVFIGGCLFPCFAQWDGQQQKANDTADASAPVAPVIESESGNATHTRSNSSLTTGQKDLYHQMAASGNTIYQVGSVLAWGGLAAYVLGNVVQEPVLAGVGSLGTLVGIPTMGVGAGKVERASLSLNPNGEKAYSGWPTYWTGWGLQGLGLVLIISSIEIETDPMTGDEEAELNPGTAVTGIISIIAGAVCHYVAWYQFSKRREQGNINMAGVAFQPQLHLHEGQVDGAGMRLSYSF